MKGPGNQVASLVPRTNGHGGGCIVDRQHVLFFELTIIVNCQVSLNLRLSLIQNTLSQAISEKEKKKRNHITWTGFEPGTTRRW